VTGLPRNADRGKVTGATTTPDPVLRRAFLARLKAIRADNLRAIMTTTQTTTNEHPGAVLWDDYLEPLNLTVGEAADALGVSRKTLSAIVNGRQGISAEMSWRLSKAIGTDPHKWITLQAEYDLELIDPRGLKVKRLAPKGYREKRK
jgi:addiction module HigA family antidote